MRLSYETAILSYCPDLTSADAQSVPIAALVVGKSGNRWFAVTTCIDAKQLGIDPLAAAILSDVPHTVRKHVDATMTELIGTKGLTPHKVLQRFYESFRTSIHASSISGAQSLVAKDANKAVQQLVTLATKALTTEIVGWGKLAPPPTPPRSSWEPRVPPKSLMTPPEHMFWTPAASPLAVQPTAMLA